MDQQAKQDQFFRNSQVWITLENLISHDPDLREKGLDDLVSLEGFQDQPLVVYVLATRLLDPDLEIRFHAVQVLGKLLDFDTPGARLPDNSLETLTAFTTQMDRGQLVKLLEVSVEYLAAEEPIAEILKLCSYAGKALGGILNDRKLTVEIRQQALYFCGEVGFLTATTAIKNLIQRIEKNSLKPRLASPRKKQIDEERLYNFAQAALSKLEGS